MNVVGNAVDVIRDSQVRSPAAGFVLQGDTRYSPNLCRFWLIPSIWLGCIHERQSRGSLRP